LIRIHQANIEAAAYRQRLQARANSSRSSSSEAAPHQTGQQTEVIALFHRMEDPALKPWIGLRPPIERLQGMGRLNWDAQITEDRRRPEFTVSIKRASFIESLFTDQIE